MLLMLSWRVFCSWMIILPLSLGAQAQPGDWIPVQNLTPGTPISVKAKLRHLCTFERAIGFAIGASGHRVDTSARLVGGAVGAYAGFMNGSIPMTHKNGIYKRK